MSNELVIYCDESVKKGQFYSDFYGGVLVQSGDQNRIIDALSQRLIDLELGAEVKWTKISEQYAQRYIDLMDTFFDFVQEGLLKGRVTFTQNALKANQARLTKEQSEQEFFILYYQFIKWAFGLQHATSHAAPQRVRINFDELPDSKAKCDRFKEFICTIPDQREYHRSGIIIEPDDLYEVNSRNHVLLQCIDVVLGAMQFRLNDLHKVVPPGQRRRGKRTVAKERVFKHISRRIRGVYPNFNIGESTGTKGDVRNRWHHPYRHWKFVSSVAEYDSTLTKSR
ncbi:DUF3800 domain-containing protein [Marinobacterium stanieri]|uniref:DUF3800 domain-containing protein n=1 Tax=Marinobacterium stanieri TaxID=49186 RepID=UPI0002559301|nr:DUF3800 domain-containing protein [Marinobacterium stanieri]